MDQDRIQLLRSFLEALEGADAPDRALQQLVDAAADILQADKASVVVRAESGLLQVRAMHWRSAGPAEGVAGQVLSTGEPLLVTDAEADPRLNQFRVPRYLTSSFVSVPITVGGNRVAVLNITDRRDGTSFDDGHMELASLLAQVAGMSLERHRFMENIERLQKESVTDVLTGLGNRRHFEQRITSEIGRARRFNQPLSLIMLDIDDFKIYNDTSGHPAGDRALEAVSGALLENVRAIDDVVRYGGEEFAIILPQTPIDLATVVAERIRTAVNHLDIEGAGSQPQGRLSVSLGVSAYPKDSRDESELLNHADIALYIAKSEGKDQIVVFEPLNDNERRNHRRIPIRLNTLIAGEDAGGIFEEHTTIRNISAGGALFPHSRNLDLDSRIHLSIQSPFVNDSGLPRVLTADGMIVRSERSGEGFQGAVRFLEELSRFS
ncbi:diguanylate cyclase [Gemmatimonadota bacterium]